MHLRHRISVLLVTCAFGSLALARQPVSAVCTTDPLATYAGATISVHVTPDGFIPYRKLTYTYSSTDGEVTGDGVSTGTVNTTGLKPGNYNVSSLVSDDHTPKRRLVATCQAAFTIREPPKYPPQMHVRAEPQAVNSGAPVTVTAEGFSQDNRHLSFSCLANRGALAGSGTRYVLNTTGVASGIVKIDCTVQDDRALSAFATTAVTVTLPRRTQVRRRPGSFCRQEAAEPNRQRGQSNARPLCRRPGDGYRCHGSRRRLRQRS